MNCKPGDMAIVVSGLVDQANVGRICEVLCADPTRAGFWYVHSLGGAAHVVGGGVSMTGQIHDSRLRPIRPNPPEEQATTSKDLEAVA